MSEIDASARLADCRPVPRVDIQALKHYRLERIRAELVRSDIPMCLLSNPLSLRYATDTRRFSMFQSRVPVMYTAIVVDGPVVVYGGLARDDATVGDDDIECRQGRALSVFNGGLDFSGEVALLMRDMNSLLRERGIMERRIAIENLSPLVAAALINDGFEVFDAQVLIERARLIKSAEEIECMRWSIAACELGISNVASALVSGVRETELLAVLNYANIVNGGEWADSRQLVAGQGTNPPLQEASGRIVNAGDLVSFDTDMIGPFGYCADISRTLLCGPGSPTRTQKDLYARAHEHLQVNQALLHPGVSFADVVAKAFRHPAGYHQLDTVVHGIGMCDEYPMVYLPGKPAAVVPDGVIESGMVLCVEAYAGKIGGREGVKLEEQVLILDEGIEVLTQYPFEDSML
jgi:Xaa-Pro dipeptidase